MHQLTVQTQDHGYGLVRHLFHAHPRAVRYDDSHLVARIGIDMVEAVRIDREHLRLISGLDDLLCPVRRSTHHEGIGIPNQLHRLAFRLRVAPHELNIQVRHFSPLIVQRVVFGNAHDEDFELGHVRSVLSVRV